MPAPVSVSWASSATPEACRCGGAAGMVSGLFGRSSYGTASEICRLWVPAAEVVVAAAGVGSTLANNSRTDTRSSSFPHLVLVLAAELVVTQQQHERELDGGKKCTTQDKFRGVGIRNLLLLEGL
jgi:hypothetical protein